MAKYPHALRMEHECDTVQTSWVHHVVALFQKLNRLQGARWIVSEAFDAISEEENKSLAEQIEYGYAYDLMAVRAFVRRAVDKELTGVVDAFTKSFVDLVAGTVHLSPARWPDGYITFYCEDGLFVEFNFDTINSLRVEPMLFDGQLGSVGAVLQIPHSWQEDDGDED